MMNKILIVDDDVKINEEMINAISECETNCRDDSYDDGAQHWRGGARKKGGKIGYKRN